MTAYYNEIDPYAAQWLRNLIAAGHIAPGDVDERSIEDVSPDDLRAYTQCHFFAGIGVWSYALRLAGWPDSRPVWTGSCPCQPFSAAGKGGGFADERHLWPAFHHLISQRRPPVVFGEQVASKDGLAWLDLVQADLGRTNYTSAAVCLCAAGAGAPHNRQRLWWVADTDHAEWGPDVARGDDGHGPNAGRTQGSGDLEGRGVFCELGYPRLAGLQGRSRAQRDDEQKDGQTTARGATDDGGTENGFWRDADWLFCRDEKWRPVEPGAFPLAHGVVARVGRLRAYGNAIVPQVAAEVIRAYMWTHAEVVMAEMT